MFSSFVGTSKIVLPKRNYCQLPAVDFCLACLGFCSISVAVAGSGSDYTATADGYYYFSKFVVFLVSLHGSRECVCGEGKVESPSTVTAAAVQLVECGKPSCRQSKLLMSVRPWLRVEVQPLHMLCSPRLC